jgi:hypothetical protein
MFESFFSIFVKYYYITISWFYDVLTQNNFIVLSFKY